VRECFGVTRERIRQIQNGAFKKLRESRFGEILEHYLR
jgi:DNA-directed RNA polymerase sigma subunit (sigma70/sigma32)